MTMRWTYDTNYDGVLERVPEFVMFGSDEIRQAIPLAEHAHPGCYEFVLVERGKADWELDGAVYETRGGDVFHTRPGERHRGGFDVIEPSKFWWLIVRAPEAGWLRLPPEETAAFEQALQALPRVMHTGIAPVKTFAQLRQSLQREDGPFRDTEVRQAIVELLLHFARQETSAPALADDLLQRYDRLTERMQREPDWRPTAAELAKEAGVSESYFYRTFQAHTGLSPMSYLERVRVKEIGRLLAETDEPITELAFRLGYPSSQHFATVFKRHTGMTPSRWRLSRRRG
ncbi:MAG: helix-turn-helix transcriptional regulator [Paenibacillaceae bacterium]|nr:helix-turn-helix transcriptional regulator [Paenibacillaceae bacterium]